MVLRGKLEAAKIVCKKRTTSCVIPLSIYLFCLSYVALLITYKEVTSLQRKVFDVQVACHFRQSRVVFQCATIGTYTPMHKFHLPDIFLTSRFHHCLMDKSAQKLWTCVTTCILILLHTLSNNKNIHTWVGLAYI